MLLNKDASDHLSSWLCQHLSFALLHCLPPRPPPQYQCFLPGFGKLPELDHCLLMPAQGYDWERNEAESLPLTSLQVVSALAFNLLLYQEKVLQSVSYTNKIPAFEKSQPK